MHNMLRINKTVLPWLFPLGLVVVVLAVAFAPSPLLAILGGVIALGGYVGVALYYLRYQQQHADENGRTR